MSERVVTEPAPAKLNPFLRVLGRRPDGYHDIETLVVPITLADGVQAVPAAELRLTVAGERSGEVPAGEENLVLRAARVLQEVVGERRGAHLLLSKRIPVAAGLGGGSADAAATLRVLNELWGLGLDVNRLAEVGAGVGSDVPALVHRGPVVARGRGEQVEPLSLPRMWWVLATFADGIGTADAYGWWDESEPRTADDVGSLLAGMEKGDVEAVGPLLFNDLEPGVMAQREDVRAAKDSVLSAGATGAVMCGSGPTAAGLARDADDAERIASAVGGTVVASMTG